ncbi:MAG TPA: carboxypeptidase-like regulatory domain-containing protein [Pyrinomonadaceae bacterium]|nr:carboxypeptidase-like regulatory domain-containing protein [Pyrinomonadaceae bacterium]
MKKALRVSLTLLVVSALCGASAPHVLGGGRTLATITGSVRDNRGNPLAGAVISLLVDGAKVVKETRSAADGSFSTSVAPGRYSLRAVADGFNAYLFNAVQVRSSDELVYRFNLEPIGSGKTAPERRNDRNDRKWILRGMQGRRSVFQVQEDDEKAIKEALGIDDTVNESAASVADSESVGRRHVITKGVVETYAAASSSRLAPSYVGMNFAIATSANDHLDLIFAGQLGAGAGAPQRLETTARVRAGDRHRVGLSIAGTRLGTSALVKEATRDLLGQFSVRAIDEWIVRDGVVVVLGLDYSRFIGAGSADSISPRLGVQFDANARTRLKAAYAPGGNGNSMQSVAAFEDSQVVFKQPLAEPVAFIDGHAVMERSRRFEFGVERVLGDDSSVEATAFFDTTSGRGVGLLSTPLSAFANKNGADLIDVANQQGAAHGLRVIYTRRISRILSASAGYSFGRGQRLSTEGFTNPAELFSNGFFQTTALQVGADLPTATRVSTILRFSPRATVFAIDPFAGRLAVYDPSLSILITQELPTFGLPVQAEAVIDARNLLDAQASMDDGEVLMIVNSARRSVRGGISVRF